MRFWQHVLATAPAPVAATSVFSSSHVLLAILVCWVHELRRWFFLHCVVHKPAFCNDRCCHTLLSLLYQSMLLPAPRACCCQLG